MTVEVLVADEDGKGVMLLLEFLINLRLLLLIQAVCGEADQAHGYRVADALVVDCTTQSVGKSAVALDSRHNGVLSGPSRVCCRLAGV